MKFISLFGDFQACFCCFFLFSAVFGGFFCVCVFAVFLCMVCLCFTSQTDFPVPSDSRACWRGLYPSHPLVCFSVFSFVRLKPLISVRGRCFLCDLLSGGCRTLFLSSSACTLSEFSLCFLSFWPFVTCKQGAQTCPGTAQVCVSSQRVEAVSLRALFSTFSFIEDGKLSGNSS